MIEWLLKHVEVYIHTRDIEAKMQGSSDWKEMNDFQAGSVVVTLLSSYVLWIHGVLSNEVSFFALKFSTLLRVSVFKQMASIEAPPKFHVLVAADDTSSARKAVNFAAKLCQRTNNATLNVVHAIGLNPNTSSFMYVVSS